MPCLYSKQIWHEFSTKSKIESRVTSSTISKMVKYMDDSNTIQDDRHLKPSKNHKTKLNGFAAEPR